MRGPLIMVAALIAVTAGCTNDPAGPEAGRQPGAYSEAPAYDGGYTYGSGNGVSVPLDGGQTTASDSAGVGAERGSGGFGSGH
jgi:hypothetical protein